MNEPCQWWRTNRRHRFTSGRRITNGILDLMIIQIWLGAEFRYGLVYGFDGELATPKFGGFGDGSG